MGICQSLIETRLETACRRGDEACVRDLLQTDDPTVRHNHPLRIACGTGNINLVNLLLTDARVDPSAQNDRAIWRASRNGHIAVVNRLLQDSRVDPTASGNAAIAWASSNGHADVVDSLIRWVPHGQGVCVDPSSSNNFPIQCASQNGHLAVVERLLQDPRVNPTQYHTNQIVVKWYRYSGGDRYTTRVEHIFRDSFVISIERKHAHISTRLYQDPRFRKQNTFEAACHFGHMEIVKDILRKGIVTTGGIAHLKLTGLTRGIDFAKRSNYLTIVQTIRDHIAHLAANSTVPTRPAPLCKFVAGKMYRDAVVENQVCPISREPLADCEYVFVGTCGHIFGPDLQTGDFPCYICRAPLVTTRVNRSPISAVTATTSAQVT